MDQPKDPILVSDDTLRKLSEYVEQQKRANDIEEKKVSALWRREANTQQVLERYADLGERVTGLIYEVRDLTQAIREFTLAIHGQNERDEEEAEQLDRVEKQNLIILGALAGKQVGQPVNFEKLLGQGRRQIEDLIKRHQRRLYKLKERQAEAGHNSPPEMVTEIEDIEIKIEELKNQLLDL